MNLSKLKKLIQITENKKIDFLIQQQIMLPLSYTLMTALSIQQHYKAVLYNLLTYVTHGLVQVSRE